MASSGSGVNEPRQADRRARGSSARVSAEERDEHADDDVHDRARDRVAVTGRRGPPDRRDASDVERQEARPRRDTRGEQPRRLRAAIARREREAERHDDGRREHQREDEDAAAEPATTIRATRAEHRDAARGSRGAAIHASSRVTRSVVAAARRLAGGLLGADLLLRGEAADLRALGRLRRLARLRDDERLEDDLLQLLARVGEVLRLVARLLARDEDAAFAVERVLRDARGAAPSRAR